MRVVCVCALSLTTYSQAYLYSHMGRYEEAHRLYKDALTILEKNFGTEHPDVAQTRNKLAWIYFKQVRASVCVCVCVCGIAFVLSACEHNLCDIRTCVCVLRVYVLCINLYLPLTITGQIRRSGEES